MAVDKLLIADFRCGGHRSFRDGRTYRGCGRLLFRAHIPNVQGFYIEVRCPKCGELNVFRPAPLKLNQIRVQVQQNVRVQQNGTSVLNSTGIVSLAPLEEEEQPNEEVRPPADVLPPLADS